LGMTTSGFLSTRRSGNRVVWIRTMLFDLLEDD